MQNYLDVCGTNEMVWFEIQPKEGKEFLRWAGCVWINGKEIVPENDTGFFHFSISSDGTLANIPMFTWLSKDRNSIPKYRFSEYLKGKFNKKISPKIKPFLIKGLSQLKA